MKHVICILACGLFCLTTFAQLTYPCPPRIGAYPTDVTQSHIRLLRQQMEQTTALNTPRTFAKIPVILVSFTNLSFYTENLKAAIDSMFNAKDYISPVGNTPSVAEYFSLQSNGKYRPKFDIYGPEKLSQDYKYYGETVSDDKTADARPGDMVKEACNLVDAEVDFSQYDANKDGKVDLVYIIYAGPPASDGSYINRKWISDPRNLIWPHYSTISTTSNWDGKTICDYEVSAELDGLYSFNPENVTSHDSVPYQAGIGVPCHEFSHGMGLPDIYKTTTSGTWKTVGAWDLMDYGCYNWGAYVPCNYTAYERWFMGWTTPRELTTAENVSLESLSDNGATLLISPNGKHNMSATNPNPTTFYLLENRQKTACDAGIPGHGMLIYKVQFNASKWTGNTVNNEQFNMGFDLIEADGMAPSESKQYPENGYNGKEGDAFPAGATSYTAITNCPITEIKESSTGVITFKFKGGTTTDLTQEDNNPLYPTKIYHNGIIYIRRGNHLYNQIGQIIK